MALQTRAQVKLKQNLISWPLDRLDPLSLFQSSTERRSPISDGAENQGQTEEDFVLCCLNRPGSIHVFKERSPILQSNAGAASQCQAERAESRENVIAAGMEDRAHRMASDAASLVAKVTKPKPVQPLPSRFATAVASNTCRNNRVSVRERLKVRQSDRIKRHMCYGDEPKFATTRTCPIW